MRLIDADAMKSKCGDWYVEEGLEEGFIGTIGQLLDEQPTIEPERKPGKWEPIVVFDGYVDFRCSACHRYRFHNGEMRKKYKFCPNCGTKMEETE